MPPVSGTRNGDRRLLPGILFERVEKLEEHKGKVVKSKARDWREKVGW